MDKSRQQFEAFIKNNHPDCDGFTSYIAWKSWQASRESLEVELPKEQKAKAYDFYTDGYNSGIDCCEVRLESMGIKVIRNG